MRSALGNRDTNRDTQPIGSRTIVIGHSHFMSAILLEMLYAVSGPLMLLRGKPRA